jgi:hypothetical protein
MERVHASDRQRLQSIVEKARLHASERQVFCAELRQRVRDAEVTSVNGLGTLSRVEPPTARHPNGRILYDPELVARLAADHTYPEWVVSAHLDRLICAQVEAWHAGLRPGATDVRGSRPGASIG